MCGVHSSRRVLCTVLLTLLLISCMVKDESIKHPPVFYFKKKKKGGKGLGNFKKICMISSTTYLVRGMACFNSTNQPTRTYCAPQSLLISQLIIILPSNYIFNFIFYNIILKLGMDGNSHEDQTLVVLSSTCTASLLLLAGHFIRTKVWFLRAL